MEETTTWTRREPERHKLPSGNTAVLLPGPCMRRLVRLGVVPNPLLGAVIDIGDDGGARIDHIDFAAAEKESAALVASVVVDPVISAEGTHLEGTVSYDDIPEDDVDYIVAWARGGVHAVEPFRAASGAGPAGSSGGEVVGVVAEHPVGVGA